MKVTLLKKDPKVYSANVYLVRGNWNAISDVNTLIDTGTNGFVIDEIETISTGVGKRRVEQVILTHEHFDHAGGLSKIKELYNPTVYAYTKLTGVDVKVRDRMKLKIGDREAIILHTPGHSNDSICIYCEEEEVLFSGDTPLNIKTPGGTYNQNYVDALEMITRLNIKTIYSGHDNPMTTNVKEILLNTLRNVRKSKIVL